MLSELHISNYALIEQLTIPFGRKLNVLTGETGAGKSIIISALGLALGGRADVSEIRKGSKAANIEAIFDIKNNKKLKEKLKQVGIELENELLILKRSISKKTGNRCFINDQPVTLKTMKTIGDELVDIHGQHEHQKLLNPNSHIDYLDSFGGLLKKREKLQGLYRNYIEAKNKLHKQQQLISDLKEKEELYKFQIKEIADANLSAGEDKSLERKQNILENAEKLIESAKNTYNLLYENEGSIFEVLNSINTTLKKVSNIDDTLKKTTEKLENIIFETEEVSDMLSSYLNNIEYNPEELTSVTERLDLINRLKMKYGKSVNAVLQFMKRKEKELEELNKVKIDTEQLKDNIKILEEKLVNETFALSQERLKIKKLLEKQIEKEMKDLGMNNSRFVVDIKRRENKVGNLFPDGKHYFITEKGIDDVSFLISTNPGEPLLSLRKIVSGGELSRIMLALKSILAFRDNIYCMVFDEADTGIGGAVAETVGEKMKKLSNERQIITITHLHQIASKGDWHIKVEKNEKNGRTITFARVLKQKERLNEIARLISGEKLTKTAVEHARTLLKSGNSK
ncbi:MAG: DNA repair protein RecN [Candidatus Cloacimonas sp. 4484_209]|nr:MAG: DNA repair protein RecN [Candidatus Cloacimonas sp. 4484_209]